ncbi:MAG TPA: CHAT domain-containing protein [Anaerolineae bacterium]|nr:CHAT domain-containing protein [Anaerolineae bacterium]
MAESGDALRLLLVVEEPSLRGLGWEKLCGPIGGNGGWRHLRLSQRVLFSFYLPSLTDRQFPAIGRRDLQALVVIANPPADNKFELTRFDGEKTLQMVKEGLADIPHTVLAHVAEAAGPPTAEMLWQYLRDEEFTILHIVAHGSYRESDGETILYLVDEEEKKVEYLAAEEILEQLQQFPGRRLPHFTFLCTCESAVAEAESEGALGGLGQRLVRDLGLPAVVAMTEQISVETAEALTKPFYERLRAHGEVDRALVEACVPLAKQGDVVVPALFGRLGGRPLFSDTFERELTNKEVAFGLERLAEVVAERAPSLEPELGEIKGAIKPYLDRDVTELSSEKGKEYDKIRDRIDQLCEDMLGVGFDHVAGDFALEAYDKRCPFPGLAAFKGDFEEFYFGREKLVKQLGERLERDRFLAVVGPSGSGKSSLVWSGLIPRLQKKHGWPLVHMTPGKDPVSRLAQNLEHLKGEGVIFLIDQFEELFTLCADSEKREQFIGYLYHFQKAHQLIITMRTDFLGESVHYPLLKHWLQQYQVLVGPMTTHQLRQAMEKQARRVGLRFEADLSQRILADVAGEPGAMPLLQHTLLELWKRRHGQWLRTQAYRDLGGIKQAIAETADAIYSSLASRKERDLFRNIFMQLTRLADVDDGGRQVGRNTRQRVPQSDLIPAEEEAEAVIKLIDRLVAARLVVTSLNSQGETMVEVTHEALLQYWPRLQRWLWEYGAMLRLRDGIRQAQKEWAEAAEDEKDNLLVHKGSRLEEIEGYLADKQLVLSEDLLVYVRACIDLREREEQKERETRQKLIRARDIAREKAQQAMAERQVAKEQEAVAKTERENAEKLFGRAMVFACVAVGLLVLALYGFYVVRKTNSELLVEQRRSARQRDLSLSGQLAALADNYIEENVAVGMLLAAEAQGVAETTASRSVLLSAIMRNEGQVIYDYGLENRTNASFLSEQIQLKMDEENRLYVYCIVPGYGAWCDERQLLYWDLDEEKPVKQVLVNEGYDRMSEAISYDQVFADNGRYFAYIDYNVNDEFYLWDLSQRTIETWPNVANRFGFSRGSQFLWQYSAVDEELWIQPISGGSVYTYSLTGVDINSSLLLLADGQTVIFDNSGKIYVFDLERQQVILEQTLLLTNDDYLLQPIITTDNGEFIVAVLQTGVRLWQKKSDGSYEDSYLAGDLERVTAVAISSDQQWLATSSDGRVDLWSLAAWQNGYGLNAFSLGQSVGISQQILFSPDNQFVVTVDTEGTVIRWFVDPKLNPVWQQMIASSAEWRAGEAKSSTGFLTVDGYIMELIALEEKTELKQLHSGERWVFPPLPENGKALALRRLENNVYALFVELWPYEWQVWYSDGRDVVTWSQEKVNERFIVGERGSWVATLYVDTISDENGTGSEIAIWDWANPTVEPVTHLFDEEIDNLFFHPTEDWFITVVDANIDFWHIEGEKRQARERFEINKGGAFALEVWPQTNGTNYLGVITCPLMGCKPTVDIWDLQTGALVSSLEYANITDYPPTQIKFYQEESWLYIYSAPHRINFKPDNWYHVITAINMDVDDWQSQACLLANQVLSEGEWEQYVGEGVPYEPVCQ